MVKTFHAFVVFLFLLLLSSVPALASQCIMCGQIINSDYVQTPKGDLCKNCYYKILQQQQSGNRQAMPSNTSCEQCRRQITGGGARTRTGWICNECYRKTAKRCAACMKYITGRGMTDGTNYYCAECGQKMAGDSNPSQNTSSLTCMKCHKKIGRTERYATGKDGSGNPVTYCVSCARASGSVPKDVKCQKCNQPIGLNNFKTEKDAYGNYIYTCGKCVANRNVQYGAKCSVCKDIIKSEDGYFTSFNHQPFCKNCKARYKDTCNSCGMPVPENRGVRTGSFVTCEYCAKDIVTTDTQLKALYAKAMAFFQNYVGMTVPVPPDKVYFSDTETMRQELERFRKPDTPNDYGLNPIGVYIHTASGDSKIMVQKGMPRLLILSTLVHEAAHACIRKYGKPHPTLIFNEGFAMWCEFKMLASIGETKFYMKESKRKDAIYGDGLRKMLELESKIGGKGLLDYIQTHNDFED